MRFLLLLCFIALSATQLPAKVQPALYGITILADSAVLAKGQASFADSMVASNPILASRYVISDIEPAHTATIQTADFYQFVLLCLLLGIIRLMDTKYFNNLWRALANPNLGGGKIKENLQGAGLPNILMNIFFNFSMGMYIYFVARYYTPFRLAAIPQPLLLLMLIAGTSAIYLAKYVAVKFSGWAFRVEGITEYYLFNVFLINKVIGVILLPFIMVIAFCERDWVQHVVIVSFIITGALMAARYVRSWQVFGSFLQFSKFHFFLYLCASELLPLAIILKLLVNGLGYY